MLKNKFKVITILFVIIFALTLPVVRAENETADNSANVPTPTSENTTTDEGTNLMVNPSTNNNSEITDTDNENFKKSDVYLAGDNITIDYIIDGNLFVFGNNVTINSQIGGDAFICANTVTIGEQGYVFSNLFAFSKNVNINGVVYDLYSTSENTTITGYVYRDIRIGANTVNISGTIGRNAYIGCNNLNFSQNTNTNNEEETTMTSSQGVINGNLTYSAPKEASIPNGSVTGETTFKQDSPFSMDNDNIFQKQIMSLGTFIVTVIVIWLLCLWLAPKFLKNTSSLLTTKKVLPVIGFGILAPIVSILLTIILMILGLTSKLAFLLLITLIALMFISTSIFVITINNIICRRLNIKKTSIIFGMLVASSIILWLINLIPFVGSFVELASMVLGLGIIICSFVLKEKTDDNT